jgi:hypothetical protein
MRPSPRSRPDAVSWRYARWTAEHPLPIGVSERLDEGARVNAGDVLGSGAVVGTAILVKGARRAGLTAADFARELRVAIGSDVARGAMLARTRRRFATTLTAPIDGRLVHVTAEGDLYLAPVVGRWVVRSTLDGEVTRSDDAGVSVEGAAWCLTGLAAYGPDAVGELTLGVESPTAELAPGRVDVRLGGRILVGGARIAAEAITRGHACAVSGMVAGAVPAAGLRVVYGETIGARGSATRSDSPTVLCLAGFGNVPIPREVFAPLAALAGSRAAIHTASARLFVFAPATAGDFTARAPDLSLAVDYGAVRLLAPGCAPVAEASFASELTSRAFRCGDELIPAANVMAFDAAR